MKATKHAIMNVGIQKRLRSKTQEVKNAHTKNSARYWTSIRRVEQKYRRNNIWKTKNNGGMLFEKTEMRDFTTLSLTKQPAHAKYTLSPVSHFRSF